MPPLKLPLLGQGLRAWHLPAHSLGRAQGEAPPRGQGPAVGWEGPIPWSQLHHESPNPSKACRPVHLRGSTPPWAVSPTGLRLADMGCCRPAGEGGCCEPHTENDDKTPQGSREPGPSLHVQTGSWGTNLRRHPTGSRHAAREFHILSPNPQPFVHCPFRASWTAWPLLEEPWSGGVPRD